MSSDVATMKAVVYLRPGVIEVRDVPKPEPEPGEVLVRVRATGVCGSDMHIYAEGRLGSQIITDPLILGHEMSGEVAALGEGVTGFSVGQAASVEPQLSCGYCLPCRTGNYNVCPNGRFMGQPSKQGTMAEYVTVPAKWVFPMPQGLGFVEGSLAEPLVVALEANSRAKVGLESDVVVFGAGPIGLMAARVAQIRGAKQIFVVDVVDSRLELARAMGATATFNSLTEDPVAGIKALTGGQGANTAIELSGAPKAIVQLFRSVAKGANIALVGLSGSADVPLPYTDIVRAGLHIETVFRYVNQFPTALDLLGRGLIDWKKLITHTFPMEESVSAFAMIQDRKAEVIKAVLTA